MNSGNGGFGLPDCGRTPAAAFCPPPSACTTRLRMAFNRFFVTGGAGFIGSTLVDRLLGQGAQVTAYDNLSTGQLRFLDPARTKPNFRLVEGDVLDEKMLASA